MKILVTVKPVPNPDEKVKLMGDGSGVVLEGVKMVINPFDEIAIEEALRIKENRGGEVVVVTVGPKEHEQQLRTALAMGADRAVLVEGPKDLDSLAVARIIKEIVKKESPELVIMGKQAVDDDANQAGQILAALMGWPQATFASKVELSENGKKVTVVREVDGGLETIEVSLPAVVTTDLRLNEPRYASLSGIMKAKKKEMAVVGADTLGTDLSPVVKMRKYMAPKERVGGKKVVDVAELIEKLRNEAKVL